MGCVQANGSITKIASKYTQLGLIFNGHDSTQDQAMYQPLRQSVCHILTLCYQMVSGLPFSAAETF